VSDPLLSRIEQNDANNTTSCQARPPTKHNGAGLENKTEKFKTQRPRPTMPVWFHRAKLTPRTHRHRSLWPQQQQSPVRVDRQPRTVSVDPINPAAALFFDSGTSQNQVLGKLEE
jgi:hypothetical protein